MDPTEEYNDQKHTEIEVYNDMVKKMHRSNSEFMSRQVMKKNRPLSGRPPSKSSAAAGPKKRL